MKTKTNWTVVSVFLFAIGIVAGTSWGQESPEPPDPPALEQKIEKRVERMTEVLELTETQQKMAQIILEDNMTKAQELREQLREIEENTHEAITGILTDEQKEKFAERRPRGMRAGPPPHARGMGPRHEGRPERAFMMLRHLDLSGEQKDDIKEILESKPENPREAIVDILTEEQEQQLKEGFRGRSRGDGPGFRGRRGFAPLRGLDLTDEQREEIKNIMESGTDDPREAILNVLTDEQKAQLEERRGEFRGRRGPDAERGERGRGFRGRRGTVR